MELGLRSKKLLRIELEEKSKMSKSLRSWFRGKHWNELAKKKQIALAELCVA